MIWLVLAACSSTPPSPGVDGALVVRSWLEAVPTCRGGTLAIQTDARADGAVTLPDPAVARLELVALGEPAEEVVGERSVVTQRFRFGGPNGSYELGPFAATWSGPDGEEIEAASPPIWVDLCVEPPRGELADIVEPSRIWTVPWAALAAIGGVGSLMLGGIWLAFRRIPVRDEPVLPVQPPDLVALRAWDAVRSDPSLDDLEKAKALSAIFRVYAEAVLGFPATAWTTTEIVTHLQGLSHLPAENPARARRLLRATDRVKFAEARAAEGMFEELDADLRAFVGSTRPHQWRPS